MQPLRPIIFGKHCLLERVSVGGMAEVFRARPLNAPSFQRFLAVKRILPTLAADAEFITMFVDEAKIAVQLNHRAVCQIYELGRLEGTFYIVMEYIAGRDLLALQNWFRKRKKIMSVVQAAYIAAEACAGLDYAHRKVSDDGQPLSIIHRDVSPQNLIVGYSGEVKLIDFGIARAATTNQTTQVGVLKGKFGYMSPEQVDAQPLDHRSDIFALGTLLWEMLTARRLFHADSDFATLERVRSGEIDRPSAKNPNVPAEIDRIVLKALARDRDERYQWASELAADLRAFLEVASREYGQERLGVWMCRNFAEELEVERGKLDLFRSFVTADDVHRYYLEHPDPLANASGADDPDLDEATRVVDPAARGGEVLAKGAPEAPALDAEAVLPTAAPSVFVGDDDVVVDDPMAELARPAPLPSTGAAVELALPRRTRARRLWAIGAVALAAAIAVVLALMGARGGGDATLVVEVEPADGAEVYLDGVRVDGALPIRLPNVEPGTRLIEVRRAGFETLLEQIEVAPRAAVEFQRTLTPERAAQATLSLTLPTNGAEVYLDGALVGGQGTTRTLQLGANAVHTVEVYAPGFFVESFDVEPTPNARYDRSVTLRPVVGAVTLSSEPAGTVYLDGVERGSTRGSLTIGDLDVRRPILLEIRPDTPSFKTYAQTIVFDTYYDVRLRPRLPRVGVADTEVPVTFGFVTVAPADRWYRVFVDGRDTGLVTPIPEGDPLALKSGDRTIGFVRAGDRRDVRVRVEPGSTLNVTVPGAAR